MPPEPELRALLRLLVPLFGDASEDDAAEIADQVGEQLSTAQVSVCLDLFRVFDREPHWRITLFDVCQDHLDTFLDRADPRSWALLLFVLESATQTDELVSAWDHQRAASAVALLDRDEASFQRYWTDPVRTRILGRSWAVVLRKLLGRVRRRESVPGHALRIRALLDTREFDA